MTPSTLPPRKNNMYKLTDKAIKRKHTKEAEKIMRLMINSLELPKKEVVKGKKQVVLTGDFVCHEDILGKKIGGGWYDSFSVCGENPDVSYLVAIQIVRH